MGQSQVSKLEHTRHHGSQKRTAKSESAVVPAPRREDAAAPADRSQFMAFTILAALHSLPPICYPNGDYYTYYGLSRQCLLILTLQRF